MARAHASIAEFMSRVVGRSLEVVTKLVRCGESGSLFHSSWIDAGGVDVDVGGVELDLFF